MLYIAMRFIDGEDLGSLLRRHGALEPEQALSVIGQAASALDAAHASGLVHRDVKPANILLAGTGSHVYLTDFGVAKRLAAPGLTRTGFFVGTVDYCSPEQIEGKTVDARSDIYALGGVLFHCLAGRPPYEKDSDVAVITAHLLDPPPTISSTHAHLPPAVDAVIEKAMAKRPEERYQTGAELVAAAREAFAGAGSATAASATDPARGARATATAAAATAAAPETVAAAGTAAPTAPSPAVEGETAEATVAAGAARRRPSRRTLIVIGVIVLIALAAVVAVVATQGGSKKATTPPPPPPLPVGSGVPTTARPWLASAGGSLYARARKEWSPSSIPPRSVR